MSSIRKEITGKTLANEVRMLRVAHQGSFLLVEGETDASLFKSFVDSDNCFIIVCAGWENLFDAISSLSEMGIQDALGFSDRDYFDETGYPDYSGVIIFTDENDIEIQIICSGALNKVIEEFWIADRVAAEVKSSEKTLHDLLLNWAQATGALRLLSLKNNWNLKFEDMKYKFADANSPVLCISKTIQHVMGHSDKCGLPSQEEIEKSVRECIDALSDRRIANGHDCVAVLGRAFKCRFGKINTFNNPKSRDLAKILRIAYEYSFFQETRGFKEIRRWEEATGKTVLKAS